MLKKLAGPHVFVNDLERKGKKRTFMLRHDNIKKQSFVRGKERNQKDQSKALQDKIEDAAFLVSGFTGK